MINSLYNWMVEYHTNDQFGMGPGRYTFFFVLFFGIDAQVSSEMICRTGEC